MANKQNQNQNQDERDQGMGYDQSQSDTGQKGGQSQQRDTGLTDDYGSEGTGGLGETDDLDEGMSDF